MFAPIFWGGEILPIFLAQLSHIQDAEIKTEEYESAARMSNLCSSRGIASSAVDMLICAVAVAWAAPILSTDRDFRLYSKLLPIRLFRPI
jgi:predicted nucleic acid-binding protein